MEGHNTIRAEDGTARDDVTGRRAGSPLPENILQSVTKELIARLAAKQSTQPEENVPEPLTDAVTGMEIEALCDALISPDPARPHTFFEMLRARGTTPDTLCLRYNAPAARRLGERWIEDSCSFLEVTLGLARLQALQQSLRSDFAPASPSQPMDLRALFAVVPGETHVLGVTMAADFFRRAGWRVDMNTSSDLEKLCAQASLCAYRLIGISIACSDAVESLERSVHELRVLQPTAKIVLGGALAEAEPDLAERVGADSTVKDITSAPFSLQTTVLATLNH